jgi:hypothetical protein
VEAWRRVVRRCAAHVGRSAANATRYLTAATLQIEALGHSAATEAVRLDGTVDEDGRRRIAAIMVAGRAHPLLNPSHLKIEHTLSRSALSAVKQANSV